MRQLIERIYRFFYYGWKSIDFYEFDYSSVLQSEKLAVDRLVNFMLSDKTHLMWNDNSGRQSNHMRKLLEYHGLLGKILDGNYHRNFSKIYPTENKFKIRRALNIDNIERKNDWERYCYLRYKYLHFWWD